MIKRRLGASFFQLLSGQQRRSISGAISANQRFALFNGPGYADAERTFASLHLRGSDILKRSNHAGTNEGDDFLELGQPVVQVAGKRMKLATEKPWSYGVRTSKAICCKLENRHDGSKCNNNSKNEHTNNLRSITIEDVPHAIDLPRLLEAISVYGEILSASIRTVPNGLNCCDVEFKTVESRKKAVSVREITLKKFRLPIRPLTVPENATFRIKNISNKTAEPAIHSICMSFGSMEGLARTKEGAIDVLFRVKGKLELQSILKKLNETIIDDCRWSACLLQGDSDPQVMTNNQGAKSQLGSEISDHLAELRRQITMSRIDVEDLEQLHSSIMQLEATPGYQ